MASQIPRTEGRDAETLAALGIKSLTGISAARAITIQLSDASTPKNFVAKSFYEIPDLNADLLVDLSKEFGTPTITGLSCAPVRDSNEVRRLLTIQSFSPCGGPSYTVALKARRILPPLKQAPALDSPAPGETGPTPVVTFSPRHATPLGLPKS